MTPARRAHLRQLAALGLLGPAGVSGLVQNVMAAGNVPPTNSIHQSSGSVFLNGAPTKSGTAVKAGDEVATQRASQAIVIHSGDVFMLRENTRITLQALPAKAASEVLEALALHGGQLLAVFSKRRNQARLEVNTPNGLIGVRGTGLYLEAVEARTYFCLCYGEAAVTGRGLEAPAVLRTEHHERPVWLDTSGGALKLLPAPFLNHTDDELELLERLVGRRTPFANGPSGKRY